MSKLQLTTQEIDFLQKHIDSLLLPLVHTNIKDIEYYFQSKPLTEINLMYTAKTTGGTITNKWLTQNATKITDKDKMKNADLRLNILKQLETEYLEPDELPQQSLKKPIKDMNLHIWTVDAVNKYTQVNTEHSINRTKNRIILFDKTTDTPYSIYTFPDKYRHYFESEYITRPFFIDDNGMYEKIQSMKNTPLHGQKIYYSFIRNYVDNQNLCTKQNLKFFLQNVGNTIDEEHSTRFIPPNQRSIVTLQVTPNEYKNMLKDLSNYPPKQNTYITYKIGQRVLDGKFDPDDPYYRYALKTNEELLQNETKRYILKHKPEYSIDLL